MTQKYEKQDQDVTEKTNPVWTWQQNTTTSISVET